MRIQHNIMAMNAYRNYTNNVSAMKKNLEKLSSGYKINRAGDDAAGLAISEKMRAQITGLETAQKNAKDGISLVQTAEGALTEVHDMLNRMVELATQSANGTYDNTTDRYQMQKEVDQLLSEINRIRDSSNFNGIKLLNGTLGLNTDAFSFSSVAAVEANDGSLNLSDLLAQTVDGHPKIHFEGAAVSAATPGATIDLGDLTLEGAVATSTTNLKIDIAGTTYTLALTGKTTYATADIATALRTAMGTHSAADGAANGNKDAINLGNGLYSIGGTGGTITLTYKGRFTAGGTIDKMETTFAGTSTEAETLNNALGFDVKVVSTSEGETKGNVIHKATKVDYAVAKKDAGLAGIDIKLNENLIVEGGTLEIDGKTFTFKVDANSTLAGAGVIDVSKAKDTAERIHMAGDLLSKEAEFNGAESRKWKIGVSSDGKTIHIDQTSKTTDATKLLKDYDAIAALIKAKGTATSAANAGTNIKIDSAKVAEGNVLTIGQGDNAVKYVFTKDLTGKTDTDDTKYVKFTEGGTDAATNLQAKISGSTINAAKDTVTVYAAKAGDKAPMVLGKGLTLQIGDTSDDFNQLNVAVQDMNAESLGIGNLKIDTEEAAQAAINKIKNAINTVSDVRGTLGATQNRLDHTINNLSVMTENIQDAESTIRDTDVAEEMMAYTKNNILIQSAQAMLAQANQVPQGVLQLLQ